MTMNDKTPPAKRKITDVAKTPKAATNNPPQIILEKRSHIDPGATPDASNQTETSAAPVAPPSAKRTITPLQDTKPETPEVKDSTKIDVRKAEPAVRTDAPESKPADEPATQAPETSQAVPEDTNIAADGTADTEKSEAPEEDEEAKKEALALARQKTVDKYIDTREFFVPIDAAARKRSIQVSLWLTLIYIILSIILVDLMLDSGMIELLQKVPHTNFFKT